MATEPDVRKRDFATWYIFAAIMGMLLLQWAWAQYSQVETIPFSQFEQLVSQNKVAVGESAIQGTLREALPSGRTAFVTIGVDPNIAQTLVEHDVKVTGIASGGLIPTILSWVVPAFAFYLVWVFLFRRMADRQGFGGLMAIGKSRAKVYVEKDIKVTFADVAGVDEAKFELKKVVDFLKDPTYGRLGARVS